MAEDGGEDGTVDDWRNAGSTVSIIILQQPNVELRKDFLVIDLLTVN